MLPILTLLYVGVLHLWTHMRAFVIASNREELRRWQPPGVEPGHAIAFRMLDAASDAPVSAPDEISAVHPDMHDDGKRPGT